MTIDELIVALQAQAEEWDGRTKVFTVDYRDGELSLIRGVHVEQLDDTNPRLVIET